MNVEQAKKAIGDAPVFGDPEQIKAAAILADVQECFEAMLTCPHCYGNEYCDHVTDRNGDNMRHGDSYQQEVWREASRMLAERNRRDFLKQ